jgi:hypothetical protein
MIEKIICAAIWYPDLIPPNPRNMKMGSYLPQNIKEGIVICGHRHFNCLAQMIVLFGKYQSEAGKEVQGFLTSENRFVNREEAMKIFKKARQRLKEPIYGKQLFSENLY